MTFIKKMDIDEPEIFQPWCAGGVEYEEQAFLELDEIPREEVRDLMRDLGMESLPTLAIDRQVKRRDHLEVWGQYLLGNERKEAVDP